MSCLLSTEEFFFIFEFLENNQSYSKKLIFAKVRIVPPNFQPTLKIFFHSNPSTLIAKYFSWFFLQQLQLPSIFFPCHCQFVKWRKFFPFGTWSTSRNVLLLSLFKSLPFAPLPSVFISPCFSSTWITVNNFFLLRGNEKFNQ